MLENTRSFRLLPDPPIPVDEPRKVLLLTRDPSLVERLEVPLERQGFVTLLACSEVGVRQRIRLDDPDILLLDLGSLQNEQGLLKDLQVPRGRPPIPVVLLARDGDAERVSRCFELGATTCVSGRLDAEQVMNKIQRCMRFADLSSRRSRRDDGIAA